MGTQTQKKGGGEKGGVLGLSCEAPGGLQAAGVSQDNLTAKTRTFEVPTNQNTTKIPREDP